jgi:AraC-like DNA-binding protein
MPATLHEHELFAGSPVYGGVHRLDDGVEAHTHDFVEVAVVGPGRGRHETSAGSRRLRHGDVVVLRPGAWHAFAGCSGLTVANCCVSTAALGTELGWVRELPALRRLLWTGPMTAGAHGVLVTSVGPAAATDAIAAVDRMTADLRAARPGRALGGLMTVLGILTDELSAPATAAVHPAVAATIARLEAAPAEPWRLEDLARAVSLDPDYLGRLFRRHAGVSPMDFLARVRAERAAALLAGTDLPVSRVGAAVGWDDPTYFGRRFRALAGLTPSEYRRLRR